MKIYDATVRGTNFEIEANRDDAVLDVKKIIEKVQGADVYPATQQLLIHQGKVLNDTTTLGENNVADNSYLFVMLNENKPAAAGASSASPAPASQGISEQADIPPVVRTTATPPTDIPGQAGTPLTEAPQATDAPTSGPTTGVAGGPTGRPNASPSGLFPQGIPNVGLSAGAGSLDFLPNNQRFQALKSLVEDFFQSLEPMFEELWNQNPQMMFSIQDHKSEYLRLIKVLVERGEGGNLLFLLTPTMPPTVYVTPEEGGAIVSETPEDGEAIVSSGYGELQRGYSSQSLLKQEG